MLGLDHYRHAGGAGHLADRLGDLPGEVLLDLQAAGEHVDDPRHLRQAEHLAGGNVRHMSLADEGQEVVFAQGVQLDVADDDHFIVVRGEQRAVDDFLQGLAIAVAEVLHGLGRALRGVEQAFALRVFAETDEDLPVMLGKCWVHKGSLAPHLTWRPPFTVRVVPVT